MSFFINQGQVLKKILLKHLSVALRKEIYVVYIAIFKNKEKIK